MLPLLLVGVLTTGGTRTGSHVTEVAGLLHRLLASPKKEPADVTLARRANSHYLPGVGSPIVTLATACLAGPQARRRV